MITIKVCDTNPHSACAYYRGTGPLQKLKFLDPAIQVEYIPFVNPFVNWQNLNDCDVLYLVRPTESIFIDAINAAKNYNVPVWIDYDDCLHHTPKDNPVFKYIANRVILDNIIKALQAADTVTFSTQAIADYYIQVCPESIVIENAFNDYNYSLPESCNLDSNIISWRGSDTHRADLLSQKENLITLSKLYPGLIWYFLGCNPWYVTENIKNHKIIDMIPVIDYKIFIKNLKPEIHISPLIESYFNECKSNIGWIEATSAGAVCLAPGFLPEFNKPGVINYDTGNFEYMFKKAINSKAYRRKQFEESKNYIRSKLLLSDVNKKRLEIVYQLTDIRRKR